MTTQTKCPFKVGDFVFYRPTARGYGLEAMDENRLTPGQSYRISKIQRGVYVVVEGYNHPGGGLYWTEFSAT